ncbi:MAG: Gfo/Idh/MocA family oxidoreductase [Planctomycetota bacterium]
MSSPIRLAVVGAGAIARAYVEAAAEVQDLELAALVDVRVDAADALAELSASHQVKPAAFAAVEALLASDLDVDAALVSTPPVTHPALCETLMRAGVAVLCEKPLCIGSDDAERLVALAQETKTVFTMATKFRFVNDVAEAKALLDRGTVGDIVLFENAFTGRVDMTQRWNSDPAIAGGGVVIDNGTHSVDLIRHFLGPIESVQALEGPRVQPLAVEDTVQIFCRTRSGAACTVDLSWSIDKHRATYVEVFGSEGVLTLGWKGGQVKRHDEANWRSFGHGYGKVEAFANQLADFAGAVRGEHAPRVSPADALASVRVIEAAQRSMQTNGWQPVDGTSAATVGAAK